MNLLDHDLLNGQTPVTTTAPAPEPQVAPEPTYQATEQPAQEPPITEFQMPPIAPIAIEELPLKLAYDSATTGRSYIQVTDGRFMEAGEFRADNASIGVGDTNLEGAMLNQIARTMDGSAIVPQNNQQLAQRQPITMNPQPVSGPDFPAELIANINATSIMKWMIMAGVMVAGSAVLVLVIRGLQTPSERMLAANSAIMRESTAKQQALLNRQMGFVEKTGKMNAKLAANAKGSNNFCIGACSDTAPKVQATDPTEQGNTFTSDQPAIKPDAVKLVAKWRTVTTDDKTLNAWAEKVVPGVKYGQLTSEDVRLALSVQ